ncbi:MAG TPA: protein-glutamate O-methyltransferase CheR, partial [Geobacteraceae bacterium]
MDHADTETTRFRPPLPEREGIDIPPEAFETISHILKKLKAFNLDIYKDKCIKRRIALRVRATHCASALEYCDYLLRHEEELDRLLKVLTIHVSQFFRNPPMYEKLRQEVIPYLFSLCRAEGRPGLTCWSVGCAGGEEPYSLALLLREAFAREMQQTPASILATDVDEIVIGQARRGEFAADRLLEVSAEMKVRWFSEKGGKFALAPEITAMVGFHQADLCDPAAFPASDLILCRNVLIYFERQQQEKIITRFAEVLRPGGVLVLGKSETLF